MVPHTAFDNRLPVARQLQICAYITAKGVIITEHPAPVAEPLVTMMLRLLCCCQQQKLLHSIVLLNEDFMLQV